MVSKRLNQIISVNRVSDISKNDTSKYGFNPFSYKNSNLLYDGNEKLKEVLRRKRIADNTRSLIREAWRNCI